MLLSSPIHIHLRENPLCSTAYLKQNLSPTQKKFSKKTVKKEDIESWKKIKPECDAHSRKSTKILQRKEEIFTFYTHTA